MGKRLHVIVVDDQVDVAETTGRLLSLSGHEVSVFHSAQSVLDALNGSKPDLILSDIGMPQMDGCELAARIKQRPDCGKIILVAVTAFGDEDHRRAVIDAGFDYRIVKPMPPDELQHFVDEIAR